MRVPRIESAGAGALLPVGSGAPRGSPSRLAGTTSRWRLSTEGLRRRIARRGGLLVSTQWSEVAAGPNCWWCDEVDPLTWAARWRWARRILATDALVLPRDLATLAQGHRWGVGDWEDQWLSNPASHGVVGGLRDEIERGGDPRVLRPRPEVGTDPEQECWAALHAHWNGQRPQGATLPRQPPVVGSWSRLTRSLAPFGLSCALLPRCAAERVGGYLLVIAADDAAVGRAFRGVELARQWLRLEGQDQWKIWMVSEGGLLGRIARRRLPTALDALGELNPFGPSAIGMAAPVDRQSLMDAWWTLARRLGSLFDRRVRADVVGVLYGDVPSLGDALNQWEGGRCWNWRTSKDAGLVRLHEALSRPPPESVGAGFCHELGPLALRFLQRCGEELLCSR